MIGELLGLGQLGLGIYSGLSAKRGQESANEREMAYNAEQAERARNFASAEAQKQRDYEERLFSTRYQITRKDLEAARYNPLLALGGQPTVPSGAHATTAMASAHPKSTTALMSSLLANTAKSVSELNLTNSMRQKVLAETEGAKASARLLKQEADISTSDWGRKLAWFQYIMDKTGIGRAGMTAAGIFGATKASNAVSGLGRALRYSRFRRG